MFEVLPERGAGVIFKLVSLPTYGYLTNSGAKLVIGSKFTQADIAYSRVKYHHTGVIPLDQESMDDSFIFSLYSTDMGGPILPSAYPACYPERTFEASPDGTFVFPITITRPSVPVRYSDSSVPVVNVGQSVVITSTLLAIDNPGFAANQIFHTVVSNPVNGYVSVRGKASKSFTQADVVDGVVRYVSTAYGSGTDSLTLQTCNSKSFCITSSISFSIIEPYAQTGDNVLYGKTNSVFTWQATANRPDTVWSLEGGVVEGPEGSPVPADIIYDWTSYAHVSDLPINDPGRGPGYDKLNEYRNIKEVLYWDGGLPTGVSVSNNGMIHTQERSPLLTAGNPQWLLPKTPVVYFFTLTAIDPRTGDKSVRRYKLVVNANGTNAGGLESESVNL